MATLKEGMYTTLIQNDEEVTMDTARPESSPVDQPHLSVYTVKDGPSARSYRLYRLAAGGLGLLCVVLMVTIVALSVQYQRSFDVCSELKALVSNHSILSMSIKELQREYHEVHQAKVTAETQLNMQQAAEMSHRACSPRWHLLASKCYYFSVEDGKTARSWDSSREDCRAQGADLVVVDTEEKQTFIFKTIKSLDPGMATWYLAGFWIGLNDVHTEGIWKWLNGTALTKGYWMDGEPNDQFSEDCAGTYPRAEPLKSWNDAPCDTRLNWICELGAKI